MKKNYQKPEIIEEIELDRKILYAEGTGEVPVPACEDSMDC